MTDYSDWKVLKSVINYTGDDPEKIAAAEAAQTEYAEVAAWCRDGCNYTIEETKLYYEVQPVEPYVPTHEDIRQARIAYRREHIDDQTAERSRKQANGTWTTDDEASYLALDAEVTAWIEENLPYQDEADENS